MCSCLLSMEKTDPIHSENLTLPIWISISQLQLPTKTKDSVKVSVMKL